MSYRGNVEVNANGFWAVPTEQDGTTLLVHRSNIEQFGPTYRLSGAQQQQDISSYTPFIFPNFTLGFGRDRINSDSARKVDEYRHFFDATVDTRWERDIRLPILKEDSTETDLEVMRVSVSFKGDLWGVWEDDTGTDLVARKYTGSTTTWEGGGLILAVGSPNEIGLDIIVHKTHLIVMSADTDDHRIMRSTDGVTWNQSATNLTLNLLTNSVGTHEDIDAGLLASIGGEAVAVVWHEANGTITFFSSTDAGNTWTDEAVDIASGNGPQGVAVLAGIDREDKLYVGTREGIYEIDTAPATWTFRLIFEMVPHTDNCRRMKVHTDGALWFAQGVDDDSPPTVYRMFVRNGERLIEVVPNDFSKGDAGPDESMGPVRWMESAQGMMYVSAGGGKSGRNARIFCHNGKGWHSVRRHGTANQKIEWIAASSDDDDTPRLHYSVRTGSATSDTVFLAQSFVNPISGVSIKREASGYIDLPYIDAGMPLINKNFLRVGINAEDLSASTSNEYITVEYGEDDGSGGLNARDETNGGTKLGDFLSGTSIITFASNAGLSSRNLGLRINLTRDSGTDTDTPKLKDVEIDALPHIPILQRFRLRIDLVASAALDDTTVETKISQLETATDSVIQVPFQYGNMTRTYVTIKSISYIEELVNPGGDIRSVPDTNSQRVGFADLVLEEVI